MNQLHPDFQLKLSQQRNEKDRAFIVKEKLFKNDPDFGALLNKLGAWMIARGEGLRRQYKDTTANPTSTFLQDQAAVFKA